LASQEQCASGTNCLICQMIEKHNNSNWIYNWLYDLKEWEDSGFDLPSNSSTIDRAHHFRLRAVADKVKKIRSKLGDLQTKMVT
jgi:hypothetical protein